MGHGKSNEQRDLEFERVALGFGDRDCVVVALPDVKTG